MMSKTSMKIRMLILQNNKYSKCNPENAFICRHSLVVFVACDWNFKYSQIKVRSSFQLCNSGALPCQSLITGLWAYCHTAWKRDSYIQWPPALWHCSSWQCLTAILLLQHCVFGSGRMTLFCVFLDTHLNIILAACWVVSASEICSVAFLGSSCKKPSWCKTGAKYADDILGTGLCKGLFPF